MNQKFGDICPVRLVRRCIEIQLNCARYLVVNLCCQHNAHVGHHARRDLLYPKGASLIQVEWHNKTDIGAVVNASVEDFGNSVQMPCQPISIQPENVDALERASLARPMEIPGRVHRMTRKYRAGRRLSTLNELAPCSR